METTHKKDEIRDYIIESLDNYKGSDLEACDLHNELFNTDYYIIGTYQAKQWLGDMAFECIEAIKEYEQDNFGEVNTDLSDPEKVVNMYAYIVGEEVLQESNTLQRRWNKKLSDDDLDSIKEDLKA